MMATLIFSGMMAALVWLAGRRDCARDPRLTVTALGLMAVFPMLDWWLPKWVILPVAEAVDRAAGFSWSGGLLVVWALGSGLLLLRLACSVRALDRWRKRSVLIERLGRIEVRVLPGLNGPVAAGVWRPVVFVPECWGDWAPRVRKMAMAHELAHHGRQDPLWRGLAEVAIAVNWFNPLVWWTARRLAIQCELACDSQVLDEGVSRSEYASLLCDLAEPPTMAGPALAMAGRGALELRVRRLMDPSAQGGARGVFLLIAFAAAATVACAMIGRDKGSMENHSPEEIRTRWAADPFPGEAG